MAKKKTWCGTMTFYGDRFELYTENGIKLIIKVHISADMAIKYFKKRGFIVINDTLFQTPKRSLPKW